jgi:hypothetical protein
MLDECVEVYAGATDPEIKFRLHEIMADIVQNQILHKPQGYLGIQIAPMRTTGKNGDPLNAIQVDNLDININPSLQTFVWHVRSRKPHDIARLEIKRGDQFLGVDVELGDLPDDLKGELVSNEAVRKAQFEEWLKERIDEEKRKQR